MKKYLRVVFLLVLFSAGRFSSAQISSCQLHWFSDSVGCGGANTSLLLILTGSQLSVNNIVERKWTLYSCPPPNGTGAIVTSISGPADSTFTPTINTPGCYCVKYWVKDNLGNVDSAVDCNIKISPNPVVGAIFSPIEGCIPFTTNITCTSNPVQGTINNFVVQFNDGNQSTVTENNCPNSPVAYTFPPGVQPGWLNATVDVTNTEGCDAHITYDSIIHIIPNPVAQFTQDTADAECADSPLIVIFTADSTDPHLTYKWYVNGVLKQSSTTTRVFRDTFPVCNCCFDIGLSVHHPSGCGDSIVKHQDVCVSSKPLISWTSNTDSLCLPGQFVLTNTSPTITNLTWKLSGGNPNTNFPTVTGPSASYNIVDSGVYTLIVSGVFAPGCERTDTAIVLWAFPTPPASITVADSFACSLPATVDLSTPPCTGCTYVWNYTVAYNTPAVSIPITAYGTYPEVVTVSRKYGNLTCSNTVTKQGAISVIPVNAQISSTGYKGCVPECFTLNNATVLTGFPPSVSIASACWSFPGSSIPGGCKDTLQRCITTAGCNSVQLNVTTSNGCADSVILVDTLCGGIQPTACQITSSPRSMCFEQDTVKFTISCADSFGYLRINFGDAGANTWATFYNTTFTHIYQDTGTFYPRAIVYNDSCASDTISGDTVTIFPPITIFNDSFSCTSKDTIYFTNKSIGATSYFWTFCNGDTSDLQRPYEVLPQCDTCTTSLTTYNSQTGCSHHKSMVLRTACDSVSLSPTDTSICAGQAVNFMNTSFSSSGTAWDWNCPSGVWSVFGLNGFHIFSSPGIYCVAMQNTNQGGCIDTTYATVHVCNVSAGFTYQTVCFPAPICFHDTSAIYCTPTTWHWYFGDDSIDTVANPCHVYANTGDYNVCLAVRSAGCYDSVCAQVKTSNIVDINYSLDTIVCPGFQDCVSNSSAGNNLTYLWIAPGSSPAPDTSTAAEPCFTYNTPGNYQVIFQLSSNNQCSVIDTINIEAFSPVAGGYLDTNFLPCPVPYHIIQYTDSSKYVNGTYSWNFGDGFGSTQVNTGHVYEFPGTYVVSLTVTDKQGCADTAIIDTVTVLGPFGTFVEAPLPGVCACKDSMTYTIKTYDATKVSLIYGCNTGFIQDSIFVVGTEANPTTFQFTIPYCLLDTCLPEIEYGDNNKCQVIDSLPFIYVDSPSVNFTFSNFGVCNSGNVCFSDSTVYHLLPYQSFTISRLWNFGDGTTGTDSTPCHYYSQPGAYTVTLYVRSNLGCFDSISKQVIVSQYPVAGYYAVDSIICANSAACFHDTSDIYFLTHAWFRIWNFGDGTPVDTVYGDSVCHVYQTPGLYRVSMCVYDSVGCSNCDSATIIKVVKNPVANAGGDQTLCYGVTTQLNGSGGVNFVWQPSGLFPNPDTAFPSITLIQDTSISLIVTDIYGCKDTDTANLTVAHVVAHFIASPTVCRGDTFCVRDSSGDVNGQLTNWVYYFGDSTVLSGANVCHKYAASGSYTIEEIVTDNHGCSDTASANVTVFPSPVPAFAVNDSTLCSNQPLCITNLSTSSAPVISWSWSFGDGGISTDSNPPCHLYGPPYMSSYQVVLVVEDQNDCFDTAVQNIIINVVPHADFIYLPSCQDEPDTLSNTSTQGSSPVGYCQWTFWLGAPSPVIDSNCFPIFTFPAGTHDVQLVVTDLNGCRDTVVKPVVTDSLSELTIYPGDTTICLGTAVNYTVTGVFNQITWTPQAWLSDPSASVVTINPLQSVEYQVAAANGVCAAARDTFTIHVIQPVPIVIIDSQPVISLGFSSELHAYTEGQPIDSIVWSPDSSLDCRTCLNPVARPVQTTTYTATIYYSLNGVTCSNDASFTITVITACNGTLIYIPNTFTPNGDGKDDIFMIRGSAPNARIREFRVFDRWGRLVFLSQDGPLNDPTYGWNGEDMSGRKLNPDVYVYTYQIQCSDGNIVAGNGNVTLLR